MDHSKRLSRRQILVMGGAGMAAGGLASCGPSRHKAEGQGGAGDHSARRYAYQDRNGNDPRVQASEFARDPLLLGPESSQDPAEHSRTENIFWADRLKEHAYFFWLLMPGEELSSHRDEAERFMAEWQKRYERSRSEKFDSNTYTEINRESIDLAKRMSEWKKRMSDAQASGRLQSLVWPSFFQAASMEADYFAKRLETYNAGKVDLNRSEVVDFWAHDTSGHLAMIGHFLDPEEEHLVRTSLEMSRRWKKLRSEKPGARAGEDPVLKAEEEVIDFKTALARGMDAGKIRSVLRPIMLEHMRREALRFVDELKRAAA